MQQRPDSTGSNVGPGGWRPPRVLQIAFLGAVFGSVFGFALGLMSVNRPIANALVFYVLCGLLGGGLAAVAYALGRGADKVSEIKHDER